MSVEALAAVARTGSFTRAAEELYTSQPSISQRVRRLEAALGVPLLERRPGGVVLTVAGSRFLSKVSAARELWLSAQQAAREVADLPAGPLRVGTEEDYAGDLTTALNSTDLPSPVEVVMRPPHLLWDLLDTGEVDALFATGVPGQPLPVPTPVMIHTVVLEPVWIVLGRDHPLARRPQVHLDEIARSDLVWYVSPAGDPWATWERDVLTRHGITRVEDAFLGSSLRIIKGLGTAFASPLGSLPTPDWVCVPVAPQLDVSRHLVWRPGHRYPPKVYDQLLMVLRSYIRARAQRHPRYWNWITQHPDRFSGIAILPTVVPPGPHPAATGRDHRAPARARRPAPDPVSQP